MGSETTDVAVSTDTAPAAEPPAARTSGLIETIAGALIRNWNETDELAQITTRRLRRRGGRGAAALLRERAAARPRYVDPTPSEPLPPEKQFRINDDEGVPASEEEAPASERKQPQRMRVPLPK